MKKSTSLDMVKALLLIALPILLIVWFFTDMKEPPPQRVDWEPMHAQAVREAPFQVVLPQNLPEQAGTGWIPTRATWTKQGQTTLNAEIATRNTWRIGYVGPDGIYYEVNQADGEPRTFIAQVSRDARPVGEVQVGERTWQEYRTTDGRTRALTYQASDSTIAVVADTGTQSLQNFASTLVIPQG
ncbi:DUF4245 domain-containing protein [Granulicoccus phenolivorans]|uniref:DUF4245 domain-containing protein n=1 Tax=Granulicoccus phenolivorans TaxID=266854 RepID=UPI0004036E1A|nr:DUF4245 domain-containing protein [Granulicoccus phenolivorans]